VKWLRPFRRITDKLRKGAHKGIEVLMEIFENKSDDLEIIRLKFNAMVEILYQAGLGIYQTNKGRAGIYFDLSHRGRHRGV
jgi:hypothetical protein